MQVIFITISGLFKCFAMQTAPESPFSLNIEEFKFWPY